MPEAQGHTRTAAQGGMASIDAWAEQQADAPGRSEAIRRLVELGLKAKK
jgi:hypothetical protein